MGLNEITFKKSEVHLLSCQLAWKLIELEKKDPLSASIKCWRAAKITKQEGY